MTSANPADPLTRAEFYNACTSVLQGLTCLQRQGIIINQDGVDTLDKLGLMVSDLRRGVQANKEFYIDGPLVRFLTAQVCKAKAVIQEMKRSCSPQSSKVNGQDYVERHLDQHISDIKAVLDELTPYHNDQLFNEHTENVEESLKQRLAPDTQRVDTKLTPILKNSKTLDSRGSGNIRFSETVNGTNNQHPEIERNDTSLPSSAPSTIQADPNGKTPGVFEHLNEMRNIYPKHSPNWPPNEDKPPLLMERDRPPLVHNGLRDVHNYTNLPQFTGVNLPMPTMPSGEFGLPTPHTKHWDYQNNRMY